MLIKANEITAIPKLLALIDPCECINTIDAMGCQKAIAKNMIDKGDNDILATKGNQDNLYSIIQGYFEAHDQTTGFVDDKDCRVFYHCDKGHGRIAERKCIVLAVNVKNGIFNEWKKLKTMICIESKTHKKAKLLAEERYYISSLPFECNFFVQYLRGHWSIENNLHGSLDVTFLEEGCRISVGNAPANFSILRKFALSLFKIDNKFKASIRRKPRKASTENS